MLDVLEPRHDTYGSLTTFDRRVGRLQTLVTPTPGSASAPHREPQR
jgi:hypothetical protein